MGNYTEVYEQHNNNESERQEYLRSLRREEQRKYQERAQEAGKTVIEEHKERRPAPPKVDRHGNPLLRPAGEEPTGPSAEWEAYERALADYEVKRRRFAAMGVTLHQGAPQPPKEDRDEMTAAEKNWRALIGIPARGKARVSRPP